jgi:hypothetical protein
MPNPVTYPGAKTFLSLGLEAVQGTPVAPTWTYPLEDFSPEDKPAFIDDMSLTGDMSALNGTQPGGIHTEWQLNGPYFGDGSPFLLQNLLGDLSEDGVYTGAGTTTLSAQANAGATTITVGLALTSGQIVAIGAGTPTCEIRTLTSTGTSPTFTKPLVYTHAAAQVVRPTQAPWAQAHAVNNAGTAQPGSLTFIDWQGLTATTFARAYTGCCCSEITLKGNAESEFISMTAKGVGWPSAAAAAAPSSTPTTATPLASWRTLLGLAGPASGGTQVKTVSQFELTLSRQVKPEFTFQNSQNPFFIQRGNVKVSGKLTIPVPADETHLNYMLQNTQPQLQLVVSNGLAGASLLALQLDIQKAAYKTAKVNKAEAVGYEITFDAVKTVTNAGGTGGSSPIKITTSNNVHEIYA